MTTVISAALLLVFLFLAGLHIYWALGGQWGEAAVVPTKPDGTQVFSPGRAPTLLVAGGLLGCALIVFLYATKLSIRPEYHLATACTYLLRLVAGLFIVRAIGEFRYVGFFKKYRHTRFAQKDTAYYSPLCLVVGVLTMWLLYSR